MRPLERLGEQDPRRSEIVELLCFGGLTYGETAPALDNLGRDGTSRAETG